MDTEARKQAEKRRKPPFKTGPNMQDAMKRLLKDLTPISIAMNSVIWVTFFGSMTYSSLN